jgi:chlorite dismutase
VGPYDEAIVDMSHHGVKRMTHGQNVERDTGAIPDASLVPVAGWHVLHLFYGIDRARLASLGEKERASGRASIQEVLRTEGPERMQAFAILGHKADFGLVMAGPDLRALHGVQVAIQSSSLGPALVPRYSFCSLTEVSEYVPDTDAYARILRDGEGMDPESSLFKTRVAQYGSRLEGMNRQRLYPEFPEWPYFCFYPMYKLRQGTDQNWFLVPFEERLAMMTDHGKSGMKFAGKVSQLITASTGLDDWEWGVSLWAKNPSYIKEIVYTMRFDRASAQYAQFGPFYPGFILSPDELLESIRI